MFGSFYRRSRAVGVRDKWWHPSNYTGTLSSGGWGELLWSYIRISRRNITPEELPLICQKIRAGELKCWHTQHNFFHSCVHPKHIMCVFIASFWVGNLSVCSEVSPLVMASMEVVLVPLEGRSGRIPFCISSVIHLRWVNTEWLTMCVLVYTCCRGVQGDFYVLWGRGGVAQPNVGFIFLLRKESQPGGCAWIWSCMCAHSVEVSFILACPPGQESSWAMHPTPDLLW